MVAVLLIVTGGGIRLGSAVVGRHRAQAVADLAAVAAATRLPSGASAACTQASEFARRMHTDVVDCVIDGLDVLVTTEVALTFGRWGTARAVARAGPGR